MASLEDFNRFFPYKVLRYADRIEKILRGEFPPPVVMHIYPSNICNASCSFCIMKEEKKRYPVKLPKEVLIKAINDCRENDVKLVHFSGGGEPLTNEAVIEALKKAKSNGSTNLKTALTTNGILLKPEIADYIDHLRISLNAGSSSIHQKVMGVSKDTFFQVLENVADVVERKKTKRLSIDIGLAFLITPENWMDIYNFCRLAKALEVDFVHIRPAYYPKGDERGELARMIVPSAFALAEKARSDFEDEDFKIYSVKDKFDGYWTPRTYDRCRATPLSAVLAADGSFVVCQDVFIRFGDYKRQSFWEIWDSEEHRQAIESIKLDECPRCVENIHNQIIQHCFIENRPRMELI
ncbi:MAG: hypothetical protein DRG40_01775 [Deltaproteobacteria bacterium]|nr:MAG: hypothetical protein DRG40_01775 [Deltaproteobacteria bacterium]